VKRWLALLLLLAAGCGPSAPLRVATPGPTPAATATAAATPAATATAPPPAPGPTVLGPGFGQPDDAAVAPDGTVYFSDFAGGRVGRMPAAGGEPATVARGLGDPEGIVVLPDGSLAVAEQARNDVVRIDPATGAKSLIVRLVNTTHLFGVDGIGWDPATRSLLVPDSPNGRLLEVDPRTGAQRVLIASGLGRPTSAIALPAGGYGVVDETGNRVLLGGAVAARVSQPDDIVAVGGRIYVSSLAGAIWQVAPAVRQVLGGLDNPQGLAAAPDGSLVIVEQGRNRLLRWRP
jgi:sugar lactone lactonase YvrE